MIKAREISIVFIIIRGLFYFIVTIFRELRKHGDKVLKDVLDARLATLQYQDEWVQTRLNAAQATIRLYQALGGGWETDD